MINASAVTDFLSGHRLAVVGASDERSNFGRALYVAFRDHGYDVVAVHPNAQTVAGDPCFPDLGSLSAPVDGAVVVVGSDAAADVVRACIEHDNGRVWLFKGIGGPGAATPEAIRLCEEHGIAVIPGACPLMFLEPVGWFHRVHRGARRLNHSLSAV